MDETLVALGDIVLWYGVRLDYPDPGARLERGEIISRFLNLRVGDDLEHGDHGAAELAVTAFPIGHLLDEILVWQAGHVGGFIMAGAGGQMTGAAGAHLGVLVAELHDLRHLRVHVRTPVRNVVKIVGASARDGHVANRAGFVRSELRRRLLFVGDRERPFRLVGCGRKRGRQGEHEYANDLFHERHPQAVIRTRTAVSHCDYNSKSSARINGTAVEQRRGKFTFVNSVDKYQG